MGFRAGGGRRIGVRDQRRGWLAPLGRFLGRLVRWLGFKRRIRRLGLKWRLGFEWWMGLVWWRFPTPCLHGLGFERRMGFVRWWLGFERRLRRLGFVRWLWIE